jgi:hypothetical protein
MKNPKLTLCVKFVAYGSCPYGPKCNYAHSVSEVKAAIGALKKIESN